MLRTHPYSALSTVHFADQDSGDHGDLDETGADRPSSNPTRGMNAGYTLLAAVLLGFIIGFGIDHYAGTLPWWTLGSTSFFILAGLYQVVKEYSR